MTFFGLVLVSFHSHNFFQKATFCTHATNYVIMSLHRLFYHTWPWILAFNIIYLTFWVKMSKRLKCNYIRWRYLVYYLFEQLCRNICWLIWFHWHVLIATSCGNFWIWRQTDTDFFLLLFSDKSSHEGTLKYKDFVKHFCKKLLSRP